MKSYSKHKQSSISMSDDQEFKLVLLQLFKQNNIKVVIESGTFRGMGSTTTLANAIINSEAEIPQFFTIEADEKIHKEAVENLRKYPFVTAHCGLSVSYSEALQFIMHDQAMLQHHQYPEIYIDDIHQPQLFYTKEIQGKISNMLGEKSTWWTKIKNRIPLKFKKSYRGKQNVLMDLLEQYKKDKPLILLDSAGGIGYLEFQKVRQIMGDNAYYLVLDDIHHLKHFRSYAAIKKDASYKIISVNEENGWLICEHLPQ